MRLIDKIAQRPVVQLHVDDKGRRHVLNAPPSTIARACGSTLRYIVDDKASRQCGDLVHGSSAVGLLEPANPLLRLPEGTVWVEWREQNARSAELSRPQFLMAALLEVERGGRAGRVEAFYETPEGIPIMLPCGATFDLDGPPLSFTDQIVMLHNELTGVNALLRQAELTTDRRWEAYCRQNRGTSLRILMTDQAQFFWFILCFVFSFSALLNSPDIIRERVVDQSRLNRARAKSGKPPLLEHVEVSMVLGERLFGFRDGRENNTRPTPRLHFVRGHTVHRAGKVFWRASHFRGDFDRPILTRTVRVKAPAEMTAHMTQR